MGKAWASCCGGCSAVDRVGVARWKAWPAVDKCLLKFSIIVDLSVVKVFPILSAVGSWEEVFLLSMDFTVSQNFVLQEAHFCMKMLALAFLSACVYWFLASLKSCISQGQFNANAERHRMFLCWLRAVRSGENQGLSVPGSTFLHVYLRW